MKNSAARLSIFVAIFLIALKGTTGWLTASISVWASLLDSVLDLFASTLNFIAVRTASRPADEDHSYGHGKAESLTSLFQAIVIGASGVFIVWEAVHRIREPHQTHSELIGIISMIVAITASMWLVRRLRRAAHETDSLALSSDALHYVADIYINAGVLVALLLTVFTKWTLADPVISLAIAAYILKSALGLALESVHILMDRRLPVEVDIKIAEIVARYKSEGVQGFHDLRTRRSGSQRFIDLHLEVDRNKRFEEAHDLTVKVLRAIEAEIPRTKAHIHTDPAGGSEGL
ncbi:MAG TPA: cation diffusion facilitator family transporter [Pyrinomonadaceae bacterium]|nr:cation diffusion facilitator family transporter [Pyrinomonadaceae bacterium]